LDLDEDANQLNEVVIRSKKTTVEIKLDKKSIQRSDLMVKGGTVRCPDNIPSVSVGVEGNVSLLVMKMYGY
jgi:hypothetical protein